MKKGCFGLLALWLALLGGYVWLFYGRVELVAVAIVSLLGSVFSLGFFGAWQGFFQARKNARSITSAKQGKPFEDGEIVAAVGRIEPLGPPVGPILESPFFGRPCVAYEYEVTQERTVGSGKERRQERAIAYVGFALTPSQILTPQGPVKLLGYPMLEAFPAEISSSHEPMTRAEQYVQATTFEDMEGLQLGKAFAGLKEILTDDDGAIRLDWRREDVGGDLRGWQLLERRVGVGEEVCAIGRYSRDRGGLVASLGAQASANQLFPGTANEAQAKILSDARRQALLMTFMFLVCQGMLGVMFALSGPRLSSAAREAKGHSVQLLAQEGDVAVLEELLRTGAIDLGTIDATGVSPLFMTREPEVVRVLLTHGADPDARDRDGDTRLMEAARAGEVEIARLLLAAGADVDVVNLDWGSPTTALVSAVESGASEIEGLLREAGARDDTVTAASGLPLPPGGGEPFAVCRAYHLAFHQHDAETLKALWGNAKHSFDEPDWENWTSVRPFEPRFVAGFANDERATVELEGEAPVGHVEWSCYLVRVQAEAGPGAQGTWKIAREWWRVP